jgi:hypothetical protein
MVFGHSSKSVIDATVSSDQADHKSSDLALAAQKELAGAFPGGVYCHKEIFQNDAANSLSQNQPVLPELSWFDSSTHENVQRSSKLKGQVRAPSQATEIKNPPVTLRVEEPKLDLRTVYADHTNSDLPTYRWGSVTKAQADEQFEIFESLPCAERAALKSQSICLNVGNVLADYEPALVCKDARGQNYTLDEVHGFYSPSDHSINLTLHPDIHFGPATILGTSKVSRERHRENLKHEVGHALDQYFHGFSHSQTFIEAYKADKQELEKRIQRDTSQNADLQYYVSPQVDRIGAQSSETDLRQSEIGREELFAEIYSAIRTLPEDRTASQRAVVQIFHHVLVVVNQFLQDFNRQEELRYSSP